MQTHSSAGGAGGPGSGVDPEIKITIESVRDVIRTYLIENFAGHKLTGLIAAILEAEGFTCDVSPPGPDFSVDILAGCGPLGLNSPTLLVQQGLPGLVGRVRMTGALASTRPRASRIGARQRRSRSGISALDAVAARTNDVEAVKAWRILGWRGKPRLRGRYCALSRRGIPRRCRRAGR